METYLLDATPLGFPYPIDETLAARGAPIYREYCARCHGENGQNFAGELVGQVTPIGEIRTDQHRLDSYSPELAANQNLLYAGYPDDYTERFPNGAIAVGAEQVRALLHDGHTYIWLSWFGTSLLLGLSLLSLALASTGVVGKKVVVVINKDKSMMINTESVDEAKLGPRLEEIFKTRAERVIFVKGDPAVEFQWVAKAIDIAKGAGLDKVGLMTPKMEQGQ
jgi:hypothetical protein